MTPSTVSRYCAIHLRSLFFSQMLMPSFRRFSRSDFLIPPSELLIKILQFYVGLWASKYKGTSFSEKESWSGLAGFDVSLTWHEHQGFEPFPP